MAKDPAFLFYSNDFLTGTFTMTDKQVGQYIRLMCLQHQNNRLTEKQMLTVCKKRDPEVWSKFKQDEDGLYYNERLESEVQKRAAYCEKQRQRVLKRWNKDGSTDGNTTVLPLENENVNKDNSLVLERDKGGAGGKGKAFTPPTLEEVKAYCRERGNDVDPEKFYSYFSEGNWIDGRGNPVKNWKQKLITWEGKRRGNIIRDTKPDGDSKSRWNLQAAVDA